LTSTKFVYDNESSRGIEMAGSSYQGKDLRPGDGAAITGEERLKLAASRDSHFVFFDLN